MIHINIQSEIPAMMTSINHNIFKYKQKLTNYFVNQVVLLCSNVGCGPKVKLFQTCIKEYKVNKTYDRSKQCYFVGARVGLGKEEKISNINFLIISH